MKTLVLIPAICLFPCLCWSGPFLVCDVPPADRNLAVLANSHPIFGKFQWRADVEYERTSPPTCHLCYKV